MKNTVLSLLMMMLVVVDCSIAREPAAGSQTHFLRTCSSECKAPYSCLCGVCSLVCDDDTSCAEHASNAGCLDPSAANSCDDAPRMCDVECRKDSECGALGSGFSCDQGRCRGTPLKSSPAPSNPRVAMVDAGTSPPAPAPCREVAIDKLDLLFMIDNSNSMADEQAALENQFPKLITALTTGKSSDGAQSFPAIQDLHVGVVSSDMGIAGVNFGANVPCQPDGGDDGRLQHVARRAGCAESYPAFLSYSAAQGGDPTQFADDLGCIAALGTNGCGFEQQLEAPLKALWPSVYRDAQGQVVTPNPISFLAMTQEGTLGHGDVPTERGGNAGFLRSDAKQGLSLLVIVVVTDEEDCSSRLTEHLKPKEQYPQDSPYFQQDLNLRCFYNKDLLFDVTNRYLTGFQLLRPGHEELVMFALIAGVPADLVSSDVLSLTDFSVAADRDQLYDKILNDPRMQEVVDPSTMPGNGMGNLIPSCVRTSGAGNIQQAYPPRRMVELAKGFGENGIVQSICQDDFGPSIDAIVNRIANRLAKTTVCAP